MEENNNELTGEQFVASNGVVLTIYSNGNVTSDTPTVVNFSAAGNCYESSIVEGMNDNNTDVAMIYVNSDHYTGNDATCEAIAEAIAELGSSNSVVSMGESIGGKSAAEMACNAITKDYGFSVSTYVGLDPTNINSFYNNNQEAFDKMAEDGVSVVINTNMSGPELEMIKDYNSKGGNGLIMSYDMPQAHTDKCQEPFANNIVNWLIGKGELKSDYVWDNYGHRAASEGQQTSYTFNRGEKRVYIDYVKDDKTGEMLERTITLDEATNKVTMSLSKADDSKDGKNKNGKDGNIISIDYGFVEEALSLIGAAIMKSALLSKNGVHIPPDGSQTFTAANEAFTNYTNMTRSFLGSLDMTCQNIRSIAEAMSNLDSNLASSIDEYVQAIDSVDLSSYKSFYESIPELNISFDTSSDIRISKSKLMEASSTGNALISSLLDDINDTSDIQKELMSFINDSKNALTGDAWDTVRAKINEYSEVCQDKQQYAESLITSMISAYNKLLSYMQYDELDTSKIPETRDNLKNLKDNLEQLQTTYAETPDTITEYSIGKDGTVTSYTRPNPLKDLLAELIKSCEIVIAETEKYLKQLEGLKDADNTSADEIKETEKDQPQIEEETKANIEAPKVDAREDMDAKDLSDAIGGAIAGIGIAGLGETTGTVADKVANDIVNDIKQNQVTKEEEQKENSNKDINNNITNNSGGGSSNNTSNSINKPQEDNNYTDFPEYNDVVTNDNQLVYNVNNECKLIIKHEGESVNGVEFYYDFHDKATADIMYNQVLEKYQNIEGFDKIVQYEGRLKVLFNEEYYGGQTLETFKETYSQYYNQI